jgi:hypothetical protein
MYISSLPCYYSEFIMCRNTKIGQKVSLYGMYFITKHPALIVIVSGYSVAKHLSVSSAES